MNARPLYNAFLYNLFFFVLFIFVIFSNISCVPNPGVHSQEKYPNNKSVTTSYNDIGKENSWDNDRLTIEDISEEILSYCVEEDALPIMLLQSHPAAKNKQYGKIDPITSALREELHDYFSFAFNKMRKKRDKFFNFPYLESNTGMIIDTRPGLDIQPILPCTALPKSIGLIDIKKSGRNLEVRIRLKKYPEVANKIENQFKMVLSNSYLKYDRYEKLRSDGSFGSKEYPAKTFEEISELIGIVLLCRTQAQRTNSGRLVIDIFPDSENLTETGQKIACKIRNTIYRYKNNNLEVAITPQTEAEYKRRYEDDFYINPAEFNASLRISTVIKDDLINVIVNIDEHIRRSDNTVDVNGRNGLYLSLWIKNKKKALLLLTEQISKNVSLNPDAKIDELKDLLKKCSGFPDIQMKIKGNIDNLVNQIAVDLRGCLNVMSGSAPLKDAKREMEQYIQDLGLSSSSITKTWNGNTIYIPGNFLNIINELNEQYVTMSLPIPSKDENFIRQTAVNKGYAPSKDLVRVLCARGDLEVDLKIFKRLFPENYRPDEISVELIGFDEPRFDYMREKLDKYLCKLGLNLDYTGTKKNS